MRTRTILAATLALAICMLGMSPLAHAQTAPAKVEKVDVVGKAEFKTEKVDGKDVKVYSIAVTEAKGADGKVIADLAGKTLTVTGAKAAEIEKLNGKEVIAKGTLSADKKSLAATSTMEKPAPPKK